MGLLRSSGSSTEEHSAKQQASPQTPPPEAPRTIGEDAVPHWVGHHRKKERAVSSPGLPIGPLPTLPNPVPSGSTRTDLDEAIVLNEDGVTGQVPMDDGGAAGMQKAAGEWGKARVSGYESSGCYWASTCAAGSSPECRQDLCTPAFPGLAAKQTHESLRWAQERPPLTGLKPSPHLPPHLHPSLSPYPGAHGLVVLLGLFQKLLEAAR